MSDMDGDSSYEEHVPLCERPEWQGVEPLEVGGGPGGEDGEGPAAANYRVVAIQYSPDHREALAYFRRVIQKAEYSERVLALTSELISHNQADYTAWEWRWRCLRALHKDLATEYVFTDSIMHDNAKNYQLWNHRRKCALALGEHAAKRELHVADDALRTDAKNYHAWAHRQAIVKEYGGVLWEEELAYSEQHIERDLRNNSAWNQRAFVLLHQVTSRAGAVVVPDVLPPPSPGTQGGPRTALPMLLQQVMSRELEYLAVQIARAPRNESAWNYLRGLFSLPGMPPHAMAMFSEVAVICREALNDAPSSPPAMDVFADYYLHTAHLTLHFLQAVQEQIRLQVSAAATPEQLLAGLPPELQSKCAAAVGGLQAAVSYCMALLEALVVADPVRTMWWRHRVQGAQQLLLAAGLTPVQPVAGAAMPLVVPGMQAPPAQQPQQQPV